MCGLHLLHSHLGAIPVDHTTIPHGISVPSFNRTLLGVTSTRIRYCELVIILITVIQVLIYIQYIYILYYICYIYAVGLEMFRHKMFTIFAVGI